MAGFAAALRHRLEGRRATLLSALAVLAGLAVLGQLGATAAAIAGAVVVLVTLFVPKSDETGRLAEAGDPALTELRLNLARRFADTLPDPCLILDRRAAVVHRNPAATKDFPGVVIGNPLTLSLRNPSLSGAVEAARRTGTAQNIELHQTVPNETWHKVAVTPLGDEMGGSSELLVVTMHNLTEQRRIDAMRSDFIANASHELRTPLTSLVGFIDTLLGPAARDAEARERFLGIMRTQAGRMSKLIDDLLSLNRIEMRQHLRPTGSVDLVALLREVSEGLQTQAEAAAVEVTLALPEGAMSATGDHDELYEVFENLIDNAIKYGGDGGKVDVALEAANRPGYDYLVSVTDFGAGVELMHVPRLTERFYRVDAESSRKKKGTGLGLAIVKHILNRHHGVMTIKSRPGEGNSRRRSAAEMTLIPVVQPLLYKNNNNTNGLTCHIMVTKLT